MKLYQKLLLLFLFISGLILRTHQLTRVPAGLHGDEVSIGYNAFSLLKTGRDQDGNFLPLTIDQFGDYRPAGYHYLDIPFIALLGINELAVRLPAALFGSLTIILFYFFVFELFNDHRIALLSAGFLTFSPWHIAISRATSESIIAAFFIILGLYLYLKGINLKGIKKMPHSRLLFLLSFSSFFLSFLFYHAARFFLPTFLPFFFLIIIGQTKLKKELALKSAGFYFALLISLFLVFNISKGANRPLNISILNIPGGDKLIIQQIAQDGQQHHLITRFFHNKGIFYSRLFLQSFFEHFSGKFLFLENGFPVRYRIPWTGNLYLIDGLFLVFGFSVLLSEAVKEKKYLYLIPIIWLIFGALPAGLTWEDIPNVQRSSFIIPALGILIAFGIKEMFSATHGRIRTYLFILTSLVFFQNSSYFLHNYFHHSRTDEPWYRSAAVPELVWTVHDLSEQYQEIRMTTQGNNNLIFHLFYRQFDPKKFQALGSPREFDGLEFEKMIFLYTPCPLEGNPEENLNQEKNILFVNQADCRLPKNAVVLKTAYHPGGVPAYKIVKLDQGKTDSP